MGSEDLAYAAGFVDGEGCINLTLSKGRFLNLQLVVSQTDPRPLLWLKSRWGGSVGQRRILQLGRKPSWYWSVAGGRATSFLESIRPYLKVKDTEAWLALEAMSQITRVRYPKGGVPLGEVALRVGYHLALKSAR